MSGLQPDAARQQGSARQQDSTGHPSGLAGKASARVRSWGQVVASTPAVIRRALAVIMLLVVGALDLVTGSELSFSVFYLAPVLFAEALLSRTSGRVVAVASAVTWGCIEALGDRHYSAAWILIWNSGVRLVFFLLVNELADANRAAHARDRLLARTDSLTGLANGRTFTERVALAIAGTRRHGRPFTIAYLDLDRFKQVNDQFGHAAGDRLLHAVAQTIESATRATDLAARLGGDEFGILLLDTNAEDARRFLDRLAASIATSLVTVLGEDSGAAATLGAVTFAEAPDGASSAIHEADLLMYVGKEAGGAQVRQATWPPADPRTTDDASQTA